MISFRTQRREFSPREGNIFMQTKGQPLLSIAYS